MFKRILIANRGEIAVRIVRACREMGIESVAVYSDVDRRALFVRKADYAYHIGPAQASESYLNVPKILDVARRSGAEGIHPGYGFLSENANFARECEAAGLKFIGPTAASMEMMGSKTRARQNMKKAGVPFVPGSERGLESAEAAERLAEQIGYPVMLKAAAGGGGKGMRAVYTREDLRSALDSAQSEAQRAFGDNEVYIEKLIVNPHHIEFQIVADNYGNTVHLGERDCSIQRRNQKVIEECPSPLLTPALRKRMGQAAVKLAQSVGYVNAGTMEFLVDQKGTYYFIEMNTRIQVEHTITEEVYGCDLVKEQIHIAAGDRLSPHVARPLARSHAIQCRINAEDPARNFQPSAGRINFYYAPGGRGVRIDSHAYTGYIVPPNYDSMIAKLIAVGATRESAIARMRRALGEYLITGIKTTIPFHNAIMRNADFRNGHYDTGFVDRMMNSETFELRPSNGRLTD